MIKKICITSVIACIVTFLLFAFTWWNINPTMWSDAGRYACATTMGVEILCVIIGICMSEGL